MDFLPHKICTAVDVLKNLSPTIGLSFACGAHHHLPVVFVVAFPFLLFLSFSPPLSSYFGDGSSLCRDLLAILFVAVDSSLRTSPSSVLQWSKRAPPTGKIIPPAAFGTLPLFPYFLFFPPESPVLTLSALTQ
jgi:hypothetical protein